MEKNVAGKWIVFAFEDEGGTNPGEPVTGDAANITANVRIDGGAANAVDDTNPTELEDGYYIFDITAVENNGDLILIAPQSATANVNVIGVPGAVWTTPANFNDLVVAVTSGEVTTGTISANAINAAAIATDAITSAKIAADAIGESEIANGAINAATFAAGAIDAAAIASNALTSAKIATDAIGAAQIAADAIGAAEIADGAINAAAFAANAITSTVIADNAITAAKLAADAITAAKIATDAIGGDELAASAVNEIWAKVCEDQGSITAQQIMSLIVCALAGVTTTGGSIFRPPNGSANDRITATVNASNERTAMTVAPSAGA